MATSPSATPTPITPPRVPLIDERTGLIDRAWYLFFLSLFRAAETTEGAVVGPNTESLIASYDAALLALAQATGTQPQQNDCCADVIALCQEAQTQPVSGVLELTQEVNDVRQQLQTLPPSGIAELTQEVNDVRQQLQTLPRPQLGTFAALQQADLPWTTFDTTPQSVPTDIGTVAWDGGTTLGIQMTANVIQRVGESEFVYVKASATITKGQLCYHTGSVGSSGVITAAPAPINLADPNQLVGVAAESIALNDFGLIQISGDLRGFNTTGSSVGETWADGDPLYYNPAYVGSMTKVKPVAPNQKSYIGEVISAGSGGSGSMHIRIVQGSVLGGTDSNVQFGTLANNDLIQYSTTLGYWQNVTASSVSVGTATNLAGGLAGSLPYQTGAGATTFLSIGAGDRVLTSSGTAPQWSTALTGLTGVSTTTLSASSTVTLSGGTANGVLYLNASNVATSGSSLVFDGTNLGVGVSSPSVRLEVADNVRITGNNPSLSAVPTSTGFFIDNRSVGKPTIFRTSNASALDTTAVTLNANGNLDVVGTVRSTSTNGVLYAKATTGAAAVALESNARYWRWLTSNGDSSLRVVDETAGAERARFDSSGNFIVNTGAVATTATSGFLYIPSCAGTPTGTPTTYTGRVPLVVDSTNNKLYFYSGGAWRDAGP